jgi:hypothetical protein
MNPIDKINTVAGLEDTIPLGFPAAARLVERVPASGKQFAVPKGRTDTGSAETWGNDDPSKPQPPGILAICTQLPANRSGGLGIWHWTGNDGKVREVLVDKLT